MCFLHWKNIKYWKRTCTQPHTIFAEPFQFYITFYYPNGVKTSETLKQKPLEMNNSGKYYFSSRMLYMYRIRVHITSTYAFIIVILPIYTYTLTIYTELSYNFISPSCLYPVLDISFDITRRKIILSKLPSLACVLQSHQVCFFCVCFWSTWNRTTNFQKMSRCTNTIYLLQMCDFSSKSFANSRDVHVHDRLTNVCVEEIGQQVCDGLGWSGVEVRVKASPTICRGG